MLPTVRKMLLKKITYIAVVLLLCTSVFALQIPTRKEEWQKMVYNYFLTAKKDEMKHSQASPQGGFNSPQQAMAQNNLPALNKVLNESELDSAIGINQQFMDGKSVVPVDSVLHLTYSEIRNNILNETSCTPGHICLTSYHEAYRMPDCSITHIKECFQGCNTTTNYCIDNPCFNIQCADYCAQDHLFSNGKCENGKCIYEENLCNAGCDGDACKSVQEKPINCSPQQVSFGQVCLPLAKSGMLEIHAYYEDEKSPARRASIYFDSKLISEKGSFIGLVPSGTHEIEFQDIDGGSWYTLAPYKSQSSIKYCEDQDIINTNGCKNWKYLSEVTSSTDKTGLQFLTDLQIFPDAKAPPPVEITILPNGNQKVNVIYNASEGYYAMDMLGNTWYGSLPLTNGKIRSGSKAPSPYKFTYRYQDSTKWIFTRVKTDLSMRKLVSYSLCYGGSITDYRQFLNLYLRQPGQSLKLAKANSTEYHKFFKSTDVCDENTLLEELYEQ